MSNTNLEKNPHHESFSLLNRFQHVFAKDDWFRTFRWGGDNSNDRYWWSRKYQTKVCRTPVGFENKEKSHVDQMFEKKALFYPQFLIWHFSWWENENCIDFRFLLKVTTKDAFPITKIQDRIDTLEGNTFLVHLIWFQVISKFKSMKEIIYHQILLIWTRWIR